MRWLLPCLLVLVAAAVPARAAPGPTTPAPDLFDRFDAAALAPDERRLVQAALAATGDYDGAQDGVWGPASQHGLDAYSGRVFEDIPVNAHAAALLLDLSDRVEAEGWTVARLPGLPVSIALPQSRLTDAEPEEGGSRRWGEGTSLTILTHDFARPQAAAWHGAAAEADAAEAGTRLRDADRLVTTGRLDDGRIFFTRSDRVGDRWPTVYLASDPSDAAMLNLAAGSITSGEPAPWLMPQHGRLAAIVAAATDYLQSFGPADAPVALPQPIAAFNPSPLAIPRMASLPAVDAVAPSTGTGFYLDPRTVVTAAHVVADCRRVTLADGAELTLIASDADLDVAALVAPRPSSRWLSLADGTRTRLGQRVSAAGFPYYSIAGTSLHLTGGNVSALAGVDDDRRFVSFTAPVQPGNSGGPLIDARGDVLGLVVARLSEDFIVEATGSLPQNINYALRERELAEFLDGHHLRPAPQGLGGYDIDDGVPDGFDAAVVPILCE